MEEYFERGSQRVLQHIYEENKGGAAGKRKRDAEARKVGIQECVVPELQISMPIAPLFAKISISNLQYWRPSLSISKPNDWQSSPITFNSETRSTMLESSWGYMVLRGARRSTLI